MLTSHRTTKNEASPKFARRRQPRAAVAATNSNRRIRAVSAATSSAQHPPQLHANAPSRAQRVAAQLSRRVQSPLGLTFLALYPDLATWFRRLPPGARVVNGVVAYGGAAYGMATGLTDESPIGGLGATAGLGLTLADAALEGGKVIPVLGNALSATIGLYDGCQLAKTVARCW